MKNSFWNFPNFKIEPSNSSWEKEFEVMKTTSKISSNSNSNADEWLNSFDDPPKKSNDR